MAILDVLVYPDPRLRCETEPVEVFGKELKKLISDMRETMCAHNGVGLAAPQVGLPLKLVVIEWEGERCALANPRILEMSGSEKKDEGCLSFPGVFEQIERPTSVRVAYQDEDGAEVERTIEGFPARIFAHEIDHLNNTLLIDRISPLKRAFLKKKMTRKANKQ